MGVFMMGGPAIVYDAISIWPHDSSDWSEHMNCQVGNTQLPWTISSPRALERRREKSFINKTKTTKI